MKISCNMSRNIVNKDITEKVIIDLGKPTRRGVKKCPNCGCLNGTRGYMCKNSSCSQVFKDSEKRKVQLDSVKLETGTARQIYSVRVKDKGPDNRGFVQLPYYGNGAQAVLPEVALCFVDTCQRLFDDSILKCHENEEQEKTLCVHIESALKSIAGAQPVEFKHDLINSLNVEEDLRKKLCLLAKSTEGPLVQRVSKSVFAVKCFVTPTNPLGYLHLMLSSSKGGENVEDFDIYYCSCNSGLNKNIIGNNIVKCVHYYACVCAFAGDTKFSTKFQNYVQTEFDSMLFPGYEFNLVNMLEGDMNEETVAILGKDNILEFAGTESTEIEVLPGDFMFEADKIEETHLDLAYNILPIKPSTKQKKAKLKKKPINKKTEKLLNYFDVLSFNEWLVSVTEQLNSAIGCEINVQNIFQFQIPSRFFELLKDRMCPGYELIEKSIVRMEPPKGQYLQLTCLIKTTEHLKPIFSTDKLVLKTSRSFIQSVNNGFVEYEPETNETAYSHGQVAIRPVQYISYFDVQGEEKPFTIEWIPNLFKVSQFGELRLIFQCGQKIFD